MPGATPPGPPTRSCARSSSGGCSAKWRICCPSSASGRRRIPTPRRSTPTSCSAWCRAATPSVRSAASSNGTCGSTRPGEGERGPSPMNIVDRRPNPKGKSLGNRQRFIMRAKAEIRGAVQEALRKRKVAEVGNGEKVAIPTKGIAEPSFRHSRKTGRSEYIVPGNKEYVVGDEIPRPPSGAGGGSEGSPDGEGEDSFEFTLSKEEFLDMFFEDLELPDLVKKTLRE